MLWTHSLVTLTEIVLGLRPDRGDRDPARTADRAVAAGQADRLSAVDADAAGAQDRGRASVPRVAGLRDRIEGPADGADDVLPAAAGQHQRIPDPRHALSVSDAVDGRDALADLSLSALPGGAAGHLLRASRRRPRSPRRRPSSPSSSAPTRAWATCCCAAPARWTSSSRSRCSSCSPSSASPSTTSVEFSEWAMTPVAARQEQLARQRVTSLMLTLKTMFPGRPSGQPLSQREEITMRTSIRKLLVAGAVASGLACSSAGAAVGANASHVPAELGGRRRQRGLRRRRRAKASTRRSAWT